MSRQEEAFTLLELMIVVAIITLTATMAFPSFEDYQKKAKVKRFGRDLVSNMQRTRMNALRDGATWGIQFDSEGYSILDSPGDDKWTTKDDNHVVRRVELADYGKNLSFGSGYGKRPGATSDPVDGVSFSANRVLFNTDGTSESGTVYIKNGQKHTFAVGSLSTTGRIKTWIRWADEWVY